MSMKMLDAMLVNDPAGEQRDALVARLEQMRVACAQALREPVSQEEYGRRLALRDACVTAQRIVRIVWRRVGQTAL